MERTPYQAGEHIKSISTSISTSISSLRALISSEKNVDFK
jgi:hypothetical protein